MIDFKAKNVVFWNGPKRCDECRRMCDVVFDGPFFGGRWGYKCYACLTPGDALRFEDQITQLVNKPAPAEKTDMPAIKAVDIHNLERILFEGHRRLKCPACGHIFNMECDSTGEMFCHSCGAKLKIPSLGL
jgi:uncharacterized C2H2 Zn-finger protein